MAVMPYSMFKSSITKVILKPLNDSYEKIEPLRIKLKEQKEKYFELPKSNKDMRQVFAYLPKARFIVREVIKYFTHEKLLYESEEHHNCVFVGVDNCDSRYSFHYIGTSDRIYVFEVPIDMLSL